ncbi:MAG: decarboxylating 6-phosphogluconate dehydrogenase [Candidatus Omnitrophica bacterium]|nr:decarboxylating 6-phosphogluconate dehydrogenase [Candidatus Omnitrophota bacterium]
MQIGIIGLGKMGGNMVQRLLKDGHTVVVYDKNPVPVQELSRQGAISANTLTDLTAKLKTPRIVWCMVPAGAITLQTIQAVTAEMSPGDIVIDGGNSYYKDSRQMATELKNKGIYFLDAGTSGGVWGLQNGYCLMIGGEETAFKAAEPIFKTLAPKDGYAYVGPSGAGHFVKMIHNGIEYGMLQAYAEGFEILKASDYPLDLAQVSRLWNQGSVVRSWILELAQSAFSKNPDLEGIAPYVADSGEGRWTVAEAVERNVAAPVITLSLLERLRSRDQDCFSDKVIAALRNEFGGHAIKKD